MLTLQALEVDLGIRSEDAKRYIDFQRKEGALILSREAIQWQSLSDVFEFGIPDITDGGSLLELAINYESAVVLIANYEGEQIHKLDLTKHNASSVYNFSGRRNEDRGLFRLAARESEGNFVFAYEEGVVVFDDNMSLLWSIEYPGHMDWEFETVEHGRIYYSQYEGEKWSYNLLNGTIESV